MEIETNRFEMANTKGAIDEEIEMTETSTVSTNPLAEMKVIVKRPNTEVEVVLLGKSSSIHISPHAGRCYPTDI